jgi:hypothetical protein
MRPTDCLRARLRESEIPDLALSDEIANRSGNVFDRHLWVDPVLVEQVDVVRPEPLQHLVDDLADVLRPAVESSRIEVKTELRREDHLIADRLERFADEGLVRVGPVGLSGVEERHSEVVRLPDEIDAVVGVDGISVVGAKSHAAQPDR